MTFSVERYYGMKDGYRIRIGDRKKGGYYAKDISEIALAVAHYFGDYPKDKPRQPHIGGEPRCPLCRGMRKT